MENRSPRPGERGGYDCVTFPRSHANPTRSIPLPILSLHVRNGRNASPDDCLAEIQFVLLQKRRVVTAVRVPTPNAEPTPGLQHSRSIAEPRIQQAIEFLIGHEVDGKPPILLARFLLRWFGFLMLPHGVGPAGGSESMTVYTFDRA